MAHKQIIIYSTPTWGACNAAKEFLSSHGIAYTNKNVAEDTAAREEMVRLTGRMATPVIKVDGEVVVGFDRGRLQRLLGLSN